MPTVSASVAMTPAGRARAECARLRGTRPAGGALRPPITFWALVMLLFPSITVASRPEEAAVAAHLRPVARGRRARRDRAGGDVQGRQQRRAKGSNGREYRVGYASAYATRLVEQFRAA